MAARDRDVVGVLVLRAWSEADEPRFRARLTSVLDLELDDSRTYAVATPDEALAIVAAWLTSFADEGTCRSRA